MYIINSAAAATTLSLFLLFPSISGSGKTRISKFKASFEMLVVVVVVNIRHVLTTKEKTFSRSYYEYINAQKDAAAAAVMVAVVVGGASQSY